MRLRPKPNICTFSYKNPRSLHLLKNQQKLFLATTTQRCFLWQTSRHKYSTVRWLMAWRRRRRWATPAALGLSTAPPPVFRCGRSSVRSTYLKRRRRWARWHTNTSPTTHTRPKLSVRTPWRHRPSATWVNGKLKVLAESRVRWRTVAQSRGWRHCSSFM